MSIIETYKEEIEAELGHTRGKLAELKTKIRDLSDVERLNDIEEVEELEKMAEDIRAKIKDLSEEMEDSWEQIKGDIDNSRNTINEAFARLNRSLV